MKLEYAEDIYDIPFEEDQNGLFHPKFTNYGRAQMTPLERKAVDLMNELAPTAQDMVNISGLYLTKTQNIAMRSGLAAEMIQKPDDTEMLKVLLDVLVDHPENYSEDHRNELLAKANMMAPSILAGTSTRADVSKEWMKVAGAVVGAGVLMGPLGIGAGIAAVNVWLAKSIADGKKKSKKGKE